MYREKYAQKRALQLFAAGRSRTEVLTMLTEEGASAEQCEPLADKYHKMHLLLRREDGRQRLKAAGMLVTIGAVLLAGGLLLTVGSWLVFDNGASIIFYGLLVSGGGLLAKGLVDRKAAQQQLQQS